ncbi:MAG: hypothetical protein KDK39_15465 [Leptospiraceae bacterium]|nr:hypothetical protein [Leptospiraceae bacterium]
MTDTLLLDVFFVASLILWLVAISLLVLRFVNARHGYQRRANALVGQILKMDMIRNSVENQSSLEKSLLLLRNVFAGQNSPLRTQLPLVSNFSASQQDQSELYLDLQLHDGKKVTTIDTREEIPMRWMEGVLQNMLELEQNNFGLALGVNKVLQGNPTLYDGPIADYMPESSREAINSKLVSAMLEGSELSKKFSPLEIAEKRVIEYFLVKNKYNKSHTIRILDITINTLKAKMKKYSIPAA